MRESSKRFGSARVGRDDDAVQIRTIGRPIQDENVSCAREVGQGVRLVVQVPL
jgi:hypothetical protein